MRCEEEIQREGERKTERSVSAEGIKEKGKTGVRESVEHGKKQDIFLAQVESWMRRDGAIEFLRR